MPSIAPRCAFALALALLFTLCGLTPIPAQDRTYVCDSTTDTVVVMTDLDGNQTIDPLTEVQIFYDASSPGPDLSTPMHLLPYGAGVLLADAGTLDAILFLVDLNGDGDANDSGEVWAFYDDASPGPDLSTPNGLAHGPGGAVFVTDDGAAVRAVLRLIDLNGNGDANDDGEVSVFFSTAAADPTLAAFDPEAIAVQADGTVFIGETSTNRVLRLVDLNGDGDANDLGEAQLFYGGSDPVLLNDIDTILIDGSATVLVIDEDSGTILALVDNNGDGDAMDPGEATVLLNGPAVPLVSDPNDAVLVAPGVLLIANGAADALILARDLNGDGNIDASETTPYFEDGGLLLSTPSGLAFVAGAPTSHPPIVQQLVPASGPVTGGTDVSIEGSRLTTTLTVLFGGQPAVGFTVLSDSAVVAVTPAATQAGPVDVTVESAGGATTVIAGYTYEDLPPMPIVVTAVDPAQGSPAGNDPVTVSGHGWDPAQALMVRFGTQLASGVVASASAIQCLAPPHASALVDVVVEQAGQSGTLPQSYRYLVPFLRGDANRNGSVDIADAVTLLNYLFVPGSPPATCMDALDMDNDDHVALDDAVRLLEYLFAAGPPPAAPFPAPDVDSAPGTLGCDA